MYRTVRIEIPNYLKEEYQKEKQILINNHYKHLAEDLELYLKKNDIYRIYSNIIPTLTNEVKFFNDFQNWLNFTLQNLISARGIDINKIYYKEDIYSALQISIVQLKYNKDTNREYLIKRCIEYAKTCNKDYITTPVAIDLYALFIDIGLNLVNPSELTDISYDYYLKVNNQQLSNSKKYGFKYREKRHKNNFKY